MTGGAAARLRTTLLLTLFCVSAAVPAAQLRLLDVGYEGGRYHVEATLVIHAESLAVYEVITDYAGLADLDEHIQESRVLATEPDGSVLVLTRVRGCVIMLCRMIERVQRMHESPPHEVTASSLPERSDVRYGEARWLVQAQAEATLLSYTMEMEPDFWIPGFLGRRALEKQLRATLENVAAAAERRAGTGS